MERFPKLLRHKTEEFFLYRKSNAELRPFSGLAYDINGSFVSEDNILGCC